MDILQTIVTGGSGHPGGSLSATDILCALYRHVLRHRPAEPDWKERDRFVLSKGHACPALYVLLARCGYFPREELAGFRQIGRMLQGHPSTKTPGVECVSGSLGQGFSSALGMAVGLQHQGQLSPHVYTLVGDGELQEGQCWEVIQAAGHRAQANFTAFVDYNKMQQDGMIEEILRLEPLAEKWRAFGWEVHEIDGHDMGSILDAIEWARGVKHAPQVIIAHTIKGKGVSFMEGVQRWHGTAPPNAEELSQAMGELRTLESELAR